MCEFGVTGCGRRGQNKTLLLTVTVIEPNAAAAGLISSASAMFVMETSGENDGISFFFLIFINQLSVGSEPG